MRPNPRKETVFNKNHDPNQDELVARIKTIHTRMRTLGPEHPEYKEMLEYLERLEALKPERPKPLSLETVLQASSQLMSILVIVHYEQANVLTSKAINMMKTWKSSN